MSIRSEIIIGQMKICSDLCKVFYLVKSMDNSRIRSVMKKLFYHIIYSKVVFTGFSIIILGMLQFSFFCSLFNCGNGVGPRGLNVVFFCIGGINFCSWNIDFSYKI